MTADVRGQWARYADDLNAALAHHRAGRIDRASKLYRRILDKAPDHPDALHMLGVIATSRGDADRAIDLIGRAMGPLVNYADAHLNLGNAHRIAGRRREAIGCYRRAIALKPELAAAYSVWRASLMVSAPLPKRCRALSAQSSLSPAWPRRGCTPAPRCAAWGA